MNRGIGNLFGIPIAISVGRRIVFLGSTVLLVVSSIICAYAKSYDWHLSARCVLALAAGQSEALVPMMTQVPFPFPPSISPPNLPIPILLSHDTLEY